VGESLEDSISVVRKCLEMSQRLNLKDPKRKEGNIIGPVKIVNVRDSYIEDIL